MYEGNKGCVMSTIIYYSIKDHYKKIVIGYTKEISFTQNKLYYMYNKRMYKIFAST